ncbi:MAG: hypothetical protein ACK4L7_10005, partial [Flavobacteriales bacterium]
MGEQHGIEVVHAGAQQLLAQVRTGIDQQRAVADAKQRSGPQAPIARVFAKAYRAGAAHHGHPLAGAGAEEGDAQRHGAKIAAGAMPPPLKASSVGLLDAASYHVFSRESVL